MIQKITKQPQAEADNGALPEVRVTMTCIHSTPLSQTVMGREPRQAVPSPQSVAKTAWSPKDAYDAPPSSPALMPRATPVLPPWYDAFKGDLAREIGQLIDAKAAAKQYITDTYSEVDIEDYSVAVNLAVTGDNGDEWVLLWDEGNIVESNGESTIKSWMESFRFDGDKINFINMYSK